ncbi:hypothetical protein CSUB01_02270 [Colletotrichum sublineola]|uniref:Uncharacterized protein n=1 Tax=Colletotrichum sublineola TaxID=1173701 RepID=A0A066X079_COLSU|nr:hypothetical protein CSUB01_02270 [Colletotrichum sublineola]
MATSPDPTGKVAEMSQIQASTRVEYLDDHEAKLALIPQVMAVAKSPRFPELDRASLWVALWSMSASDMPETIEEIRTSPYKLHSRGELIKWAFDIPRLLKIFRGGKARDPYGGGLAAMNDNNAGSSRNETGAIILATQALQRDENRCVITNTSFPKVCYIFPFNWKHQKDIASPLIGMRDLWGAIQTHRFLEKVYDNEYWDTFALHTAANMICLNATLREWWHMGFFGLEPMEKPRPSDEPGSTPGSSETQTRKWAVRLRFQWLKKTNIRDLKTVVDFSDDPVLKLQELECPQEIFDAATGQQISIENGHIFTITADSPDALPDYDILLLQWNLLRMWRLGGGADPTIYHLYWPEDDEAESSDSSSTMSGSEVSADDATV